jgi:hypothetical protein
LRDPCRPRAHHGQDAPFQLGFRRSLQQPLDRRAVDLVAVFFGDGPAHAHERASDVLLRDSRAQGVEVGLALENDIDSSARGRGLQREARLVGVDFPEQKPLAPFLAVMKATDRAGIGDALPPCDAFLLPCLMPVDVPEHEGLGLGTEQGTGRELVIEAGHRHAVLAHAAEHRAVRHADGRHALPTCRAVDRRVAAQQQGQVLAHGLRGFRRTDRCGHHRLVHRGDAGKQGTSTGRQTIETPTGRSEPFVLGREGDLRDTAGHMHRMPSAQQPEDRQGARWLMRECPLQHQHRAVVSQSPHLRDQPFGGRGMQVQAMVGGIARENRRLRTQRDGPVDGSAEATVGFRQFLGTVVQIGEMRDADHAVLPREASCISLAILSR